MSKEPAQQVSAQAQLDAEVIARMAAQAATDKKAFDTCIIDVRGQATYCDFLVIATGLNDRHVQAVANGIDEQVSPHATLIGREGLANGQWVLLDFGDVIAHIFYAPTRRVYDLEALWRDVPRLDFVVPPELKGGAELYDTAGRSGLRGAPDDDW